MDNLIDNSPDEQSALLGDKEMSLCCQESHLPTQRRVIVQEGSQDEVRGQIKLFNRILKSSKQLWSWLKYFLFGDAPVKVIQHLNTLKGAVLSTFAFDV